MLHLSPETGKWLSCPFGDDEKCELKYHAPVGEGKVADSFLWEMYASEELYREPSKILHTIRIWFNADGHHHREYDLPAAEWKNGRKEWWINGKQHRVDGPAIETASGGKEWYQNNQLHRTDGPAIETASGRKEWYQNDKLHRTDGPAIEDPDGYREWRVNELLHRTDGPAVEYADGGQEWWVNGVQTKPRSAVS